MPPAKQPAPKTPRPRGWRIFFTTFKWCRISLLLLVLVVIILGLFLDHVGLPDWLERRVEAQFRANGWEMKFSRLRLRWYRGIVAEDVQLQRTNTLLGPHLFLPSAEFRLNWKALRHLDLEADSVLLRGGSLRWPVPGTNEARRTFTLNEAGGELVFHSGDHWELKYLEAELLGAHVRFRGDITNASLIRDWKLAARPERPGAAPENFWHRLLRDVEQIRFTGTPEVNLIFNGDARDWKSFDAQLRFTAHAVESPWGGGTNVSLTAHLLPPPRPQEAMRVDLKLSAEHAHHDFGLATNLSLTLVTEPSFTQLLPTNTLALLELRGVQTRLGEAGRAFLELRSNPDGTSAASNQTRLDLTVEQFAGEAAQIGNTRLTATGVHSATNFLPAVFDTHWTFRDARTPWATSQWTAVTTKLNLPEAAGFRLSETNLIWPERLRPLPFAAAVSCSNAIAPGLELERAGLKVRWRFPELEVTTDSETTAGSADVRVNLNTETLEARLRADSRFDPKSLAAFFPTNARPWFSFIVFDSSPRVRVEGRAILPAWTNRQPDWAGEVLSSLSLAGQFNAERGACHNVPFMSVHVPFALTNLFWTLNDAAIARPEGAIRISGGTDQRSGEFHGTIHSAFDPLSLRAAFPHERAQRVFGLFELPVPPHLAASVRGNWRDLSTLNADATIAITNATFREQAIKACLARMTYTNQFISILEPIVLREGEQGMASGLGIDLAGENVFLTNAVGRIAARAITKCIGPETDRAIAPFIFDLPPDARAHGVIPFNPENKTADVRFDIEGGPFHWLNFHLEHIKGVMLWQGSTLTITNLAGRWRGADVNGSVRLHFTPKGQGDLFSFQARVENANLQTVLRDLQPGKTNKTEGRVSGELIVTSADTFDWKSWQGHGHARLTNGLLWEIPIFGVFSPILNTILPGLGNSRARSATATYVISNSVIHTADLEIRATAMRMNYDGQVDFERKVDGRMQAELFRDVPAFGFLLSKLLWPVTKLFEYKITGTLDDPKTRELYFVPRVLLMPLHPFKTMKDFFNTLEKLDDKLDDKPADKPPATPAKPPE